MARLFQLISAIWQTYREGTWRGTARYIQFKRLRKVAKNQWVAPAGHKRGLGIVGAGDYVASIHLPCLHALNEPLYALASNSSNSARALAKVYGIGVIHPGLIEMVADPCCDALLIATPHHLHPGNILTAMHAGLYTYCEKPVAIDASGVEQVATQGLTHPSAAKIMIGFNRRFAPAVVRLRGVRWLQAHTRPMEMHYRVNFGPRVDNMMSDPGRGGGRIHGAACHYVDMIAFLTGSPITRVSAMAIADGDDSTFVAVLKLLDGSLASLTLTSEGSRKFDTKEEIMISCDEHTARIRNFNELKVDQATYKFRRHAYGAMAAMRAFLEAKRNGNRVPVGLAEGIAATRVTIAIQRSLQRNGEPQEIDHVPDMSFQR
jgi:predicted dehydrogenase